MISISSDPIGTPPSTWGSNFLLSLPLSRPVPPLFGNMNPVPPASLTPLVLVLALNS